MVNPTAHGGDHPDDDGVPRTTEPVDDADRFAAQARVDDAVRDRHRRAAAAARALEDAEVPTALLAAVDRTATVHLIAGAAPLTATVFAVGSDVVELHAPAATWWIALASVAAVETTAALHGDPADRAAVSMASLASDLVDTGEQVTATIVGGASLHGEVLAVGSVLTLRLHHPGRTAVVPLEHLVAITRRERHGDRV